jgi:hypothetical protein
MLQITKQELVDKLQLESVEVKFIKANGEERVMNCTQKMISIPEEYHPKGNKVAQTDTNGNVLSNDNITVWDLDVQGWRMFNFNKVLSVK